MDINNLSAQELRELQSQINSRLQTQEQAEKPQLPDSLREQLEAKIAQCLLAPYPDSLTTVLNCKITITCNSDFSFGTLEECLREGEEYEPEVEFDVVVEFPDNEPAQEMFEERIQETVYDYLDSSDIEKLYPNEHQIEQNETLWDETAQAIAEALSTYNLSSLEKVEEN